MSETKKTFVELVNEIASAGAVSAAAVPAMPNGERSSQKGKRKKKQQQPLIIKR